MKRIALPFFAASILLGCQADPAVDNLPPTLNIDVGSTVDYVIGEGNVRITITGTDPEGGPVTLGMVDQPAQADFTPFEEWAVFDWAPIASDVTPQDQPKQLIFWAQDQLGDRTERVVNVNVRVGNGQPSFLNSPTVLHNVDTGKPVRFDVRIRDDDSQRVALVMLSAKSPDRAEFEITGDKTGRFEWQPSETQLEYRTHFVTFVANDGLNDPVEQKVSILLNKGGSEDARPTLPEEPTDPTACFYEDRVRHTPLGAQYGAMDYRIEATLAGEAVDKYDRLVLNHSSQDVWNDYDVQLDGAEMTAENGVFVGTIPNPLLPAGQSQEIYYEICAIDDDSTDDDAVLCGPSNLYHSFVAYSPDDDGSCFDDDGANHSFETASTLVDDFNWEHRRGCMGAPDYFKIDLQAQQDGDVIFTYPFQKGVKVEMFDAGQNPLDSEPSACSGFATILMENETDATTTRYFRVTANNVPYQISPYLYAPSTTCAPTDIEPNNTQANATPIGTDGSAEPLQEICGANEIDVFEFFANEGEQIEATIAFTHADGDLDLHLFGPDEASEIVGGFGATESLTVTDNETIEWIAEKTGNHYLRVEGYSGANNTYTLTNTISQPPACMDDDQFSGNQSEANAADIQVSGYSNLSVCGGTSDWYTFDAQPDDYISITLRVLDGSLDDVQLDAFLMGTPFAGAMRNGDKITLEVYSPGDSTFTLQVQSTSDITYNLTLGYII